MIHNLCVEELDPRLYDLATNMQGKGFVYPANTTPHSDVIIPLDNEDIDNLFTYQIIPSLPTLPPSVKRIWIYDMYEEAINLVVQLDEDCQPLHTYYLLDPLPHQ